MRGEKDEMRERKGWRKAREKRMRGERGGEEEEEDEW